MKCHHCGAEEQLDGTRMHSPECVFAEAPIVYDVHNRTLPIPRTGTQEPIGRTLTQAESDAQPKPAPMRVMQFVGNVELTPEGEPLRVTVLISGGLAGAYELGDDAELSIGDAVDLALTRAGRRMLSVDVR